MDTPFNNIDKTTFFTASFVLALFGSGIRIYWVIYNIFPISNTGLIWSVERWEAAPEGR